MAPNFQSIPILNLSRAAFLQELHVAITEVGFLYISNHEVSHEASPDMKAILPRLFGLCNTKEEVAL